MISKITEALAKLTSSTSLRVIVRLIFLVLTIYAVSYFFSNRNEPLLAPTTDSIFRQALDKNGKLIAIIKTQQEKIISQDKTVDSLAKALSIRKKSIQAVDKYITRTDTLIKDSVIFYQEGDTAVFHKKDSYLDLTAYTLRDKSWFKLKLTDTLYRVEQLRTPFFKRPYTQIYLTNASPYTQITAGSSLKVTAPRPLLTIGPSIGWNPVTQKITPAISIQLPVITIYRK